MRGKKKGITKWTGSLEKTDLTLPLRSSKPTPECFTERREGRSAERKDKIGNLHESRTAGKRKEKRDTDEDLPKKDDDIIGRLKGSELGTRKWRASWEGKERPPRVEDKRAKGKVEKSKNRQDLRK